mmetsp:Transcript_30562/g.71380  ORF Transcript_30562/g.71380 Transcript_30562/m.71380 type:complete len:608 (+) Transcript_30562:2-1825(+)
MALLMVALLLHDLSLLQEDQRRRILSLSGATRHSPRLWAFIKRAHCRKTFSQLRKQHWIVWLLVFPVMLLWQAILFMTFFYPLVLLVSLFCVGPVRMARVLVFLSSAFTMLWAIVFLIALLVQEADEYFAVMWTSDETDTAGCICFCEYKLQLVVVERLSASCVFVILGTFSVFFRALKGLRRPQWAGLFSVLYSVPINVYPVEWTRPEEAGGGPIYRRDEGEAVQSEPAFDPFCLMDEQPESGNTRVVLKPTPVYAKVEGDDEGDNASMLDSEAELVEIGCCGFPMRKKKRKLPSSYAEDSGDCHEEEGADGDLWSRQSGWDSCQAEVNDVAQDGDDGGEIEMEQTQETALPGSSSAEIFVEIQEDDEVGPLQRGAVDSTYDPSTQDPKVTLSRRHSGGLKAESASVTGRASDVDSIDDAKVASSIWSEEQDSISAIAAPSARFRGGDGKAAWSKVSNLSAVTTATPSAASDCGHCPVEPRKAVEDDADTALYHSENLSLMQPHAAPEETRIAREVAEASSPRVDPPRPSLPVPRLPLGSVPAREVGPARRKPGKREVNCEDFPLRLVTTVMSTPLQSMCTTSFTDALRGTSDLRASASHYTDHPV